MFIVQRRDAIPCENAKEVAPGDIPPMKPEFLPRPYGWEVFNRETDPNNPYNVIDSARPDATPPRPGPAPQATPPAPTTPAPGPKVAAPPPAPEAPALAFSARDRRDLAAIIEARQRVAPATFVRAGSSVERGIELRLARSEALESRVRAASGLASGSVVAFHVIAHADAEFWGNVTFVQGHVAHYPDAADSRQVQVVEGALGALGAGDQVLGYMVLPEGLDPSQPMDLYWDDHQRTATLSPASRAAGS